MLSAEEKLIQIISKEEEEVIHLCQELVRRPSEDPPGDTREIADYINNYFKSSDVDCEIINPHPEKPNVVATIKGSRPGPHVVFNGHMDTFPVGDSKGWNYDPFGGDIVDGLLYGRGSSDMKGGLASCIYSAVLLNQIKDQLEGTISVTCVSDEEVFGPWGSKYLLEKLPLLHGDALINGEPSSLDNIRIGEKGQYWFKFISKSQGGHGAYSALKRSAITEMIELINDLKNLPEELNNIPEKYRLIMEEARVNYDSLLCNGATDAALSASINVGVINGGLSVNMVPEKCVAEMDFRLPPGIPNGILNNWIEEIVNRHPYCSVEEIDSQDAQITDPNHMLVKIAKNVAEETLGRRIYKTFSLGGTEARLWRKFGVPAITYGPNHHNMGSPNEYIVADELKKVLRVHSLTALRFIKQKSNN